MHTTAHVRGLIQTPIFLKTPTSSPERDTNQALAKEVIKIQSTRDWALSENGYGRIGGWGGESNREIVSCRACVRARGSDA